MPEWKSETIEDCLVRLPLAAFSKLQTRDYRPSGRYPIIDQGQSLIAGWTDDEGGLIAQNLPVVVFGDHTRAFKFVDFPFVRGADGTQVLKPKADIDPLFFYYALRAVDLPARGYNRHFKALKEQEISLPTKPEQDDIARVLKAVEGSLNLQDEELAAWDRCKRAAMATIFTRGLNGEAQKVTDIGSVPESWDLVPISSLGQVVTGNTPPTKDASNYDGGVVPFVAPGDIDHGCRIRATAKRITKKGLATVRPIPPGTTCFVCIGSTIGKVGYAPEELSATNQQINSIIPSSDLEPQYVFYLMTYWSDHVRNQASPSPVPILSKGAFEQIDIFTTKDREEQRAIVAILNAIDRKIDLHKRKRAVLDELFKSLLHRLMTGEIRVADLDLSSLNKKAVAA